MDNPFSVDYSDHKDTKLVELSITGDKSALQSLIMRHQIFVYNLALKMSKNKQDAEDLTQEVFIKAITALSQFKEKSSFRTWLYRITVNHFLNSKKRATELQTTDFESYFNSIDNIPNYSLNESEEKDMSETIEEIRINCTSGMLLCLSREQRMIYILGEMFEINHNLGGQILDISAGNFRVKLSRARKDLYNWMNKKCGLVNAKNPCRCSKKTRGYIAAGKVDPDNLQFNTKFRSKISELSKDKAVEITDSIETLNKKIFQDHPLQESERASKIMSELSNNNIIKTILDI